MSASSSGSSLIASQNPAMYAGIMVITKTMSSQPFPKILENKYTGMVNAPAHKTPHIILIAIRIEGNSVNPIPYLLRASVKHISSGYL